MPNVHSYTWHNKSCSPKFKLNAGTSASGKILIKSVSIRNVNRNVMQNGTERAALEQVIGTIQDNNPFMIPIYDIQVDGAFTLIW